MAFLLLAVGIVMIAEGLAYALAPSLVERMLELLRSLPETAVRQIGLLVLVTGVILLWCAFQLGF